MSVENAIEQLQTYRSASEFRQPIPEENIFSLSFRQELEKTVSEKGTINESQLMKIEKYRNRHLANLKGDQALSVYAVVFQIFKSYESSKDLRHLNIVLKIFERALKLKKLDDQLVQSVKRSIEDQVVKEVNSGSRSIASNRVRLFSERQVNDPVSEFSKCSLQIESKYKVVVFSPNPKSNYTLSVLALLEKSGVEVCAVVVRKLFNLKRIFREFRRDGTRLVNKVYRKLILNDSLRLSPQGRNLSDTINELEIKERSVYEWCKKRNITAFSCNEFNDQTTVEFLTALNYEFAVFTGGGILSMNVLDTAKKGILNCHAGLLPHYRGMDVIEWPVLMNDQDNTGCTVHFMSSGVDQGEMLLTHKLSKKLDIKSARYELESLAPYLQVMALVRYMNEGKSFSQEITEGIHHYVMHPFLFDLAYKNSTLEKSK